MSKKNDNKSAVARLKKYELHDRTEQPVVDRDTRHELNHGPVGCRSSNTRQMGCVFQDMDSPKLLSILRKSSDMQKPIQRVKFTKAIARHTKIRDQNPSLGKIWPGEPHELQNLRIGLRRRQSGKSKVPAKQRGSWPKVYWNWRRKNRATFFSPSENRCFLASTLELEEREIVVDSGASNAYDQQKGHEWCWNGFLDEIVLSYDSHNRQWRSADVWRGYSVCQRIVYILKALRWKRIFSWMDMDCQKNHISFKTGFG